MQKQSPSIWWLLECELCLWVSVKIVQVQRYCLSHSLAQTLLAVRLGGLWSRSRAAELWVSEIQAAEREPESTVGCRTLTLGG